MIRFKKECRQYGWLSNFAPYPVRDSQGRLWRTTEHLYQACKTADLGEQVWVQDASSAYQSRQRGRQVTLRPDWEETKVRRMRAALKLKLAQHPELKDRLRATGDEELVEWAPWDRYWGDGGDGTGLNMLGKLWMELREELR